MRFLGRVENTCNAVSIVCVCVCVCVWGGGGGGGVCMCVRVCSIQTTHTVLHVIPLNF